VSETSDDGRFNKVSFAFDDVTAEFDFASQFLHFGQSFKVTLESDFGMHGSVESSVVEGIAQSLDDGAVGFRQTLDNLIVNLLVDNQPPQGGAPVVKEHLKRELKIFFITATKDAEKL